MKLTSLRIWMVTGLVMACALGLQQRAESRQTEHRTLYGVSVGDDARASLARLGLAPPRSASGSDVRAGAQPVGEYRVFLADNGRALVGLVFDTKIRVIVIHPRSGDSLGITDPFGVRLNDSRGQLTTKRGRPDAMSNGEYVYGQLHGLHWFYSIHAGRVSAIGVSDEHS